MDRPGGRLDWLVKLVGTESQNPRWLQELSVDKVTPDALKRFGSSLSSQIGDLTSNLKNLSKVDLGEKLTRLVGTETQHPQWLKSLNMRGLAGKAGSAGKSAGGSIRDMIHNVTVQIGNVVGGAANPRPGMASNVAGPPTPEAARNQQALFAQGEALKQARRSRIEALRDRLDHAKKLRDAGAIDKKTYKREVRAAGSDAAGGGVRGAVFGPAANFIAKHPMVAGVVAAFGTLGVTVAAFVKAFMSLKGVVESRLEGMRRLSQYDGRIAAAFAQLQVNDIRRDIVRGKVMGGDAENLAGAINDLRNSLLPIELMLTKGLTRLSTNIATGLSLIATVIGNFIPELGKALGDIADEIKKAQKEAQNANLNFGLHDVLMDQKWTTRRPRAPLPPLG